MNSKLFKIWPQYKFLTLYPTASLPSTLFLLLFHSSLSKIHCSFPTLLFILVNLIQTSASKDLILSLSEDISIVLSLPSSFFFLYSTNSMSLPFSHHTCTQKIENETWLIQWSDYSESVLGLDRSCWFSAYIWVITYTSVNFREFLSLCGC